VTTLALSNLFRTQLHVLKIQTDPIWPQQKIEEVMSLARIYGLTVYDACNLELAVRVQARVVRFNSRLLQAVTAAGVVCNVVS
jgi:predicted nucleic acid-binding protein